MQDITTLIQDKPDKDITKHQELHAAFETATLQQKEDYFKSMTVIANNCGQNAPISARRFLYR
ncbi:unnamed protein product, partial [Rotaria sp. Silwood1]